MSFNFTKEKYWVIFFNKEFDVYKFQKKKRIKPNTKTVKYKRKDPYILNLNAIGHRKGLNIYYYIEMGKGQVSIQKFKGHIITQQYVDSILTDKFFGQVTAKLTASKVTTQLIYLISGGLIGGYIGFTLANMF